MLKIKSRRKRKSGKPYGGPVAENGLAGDF